MQKLSDAILPLTVQIVSAHVGHNEISSAALPRLIQDVYRALANAETTTAARVEPAAPERKLKAETPRAATSRSVFDDHLVCLDCGLHMKMLKRHLQTVHNVTPAQYRTKWGLPGDYPMVTSRYAALRSTLAKESGLGKRPDPRGR